MFKATYGPWALVTGASDGIGREIAQLLAAKGMNLVLVARRADRLTQLADALGAAHRVDARPVAADLGVASDVERITAAIDGVDIGLYVANAGFGSAGAFADIDLGAELNMIDVNCRALTALAHTIANKMRGRQQGGMIFLSSIVAFQGVGNAATYSATKAYVQALAEALALELAADGIDVLASAPGPVATGFAKRADMRMASAATPQIVARATLGALGRRRVVRPGFQSKLLGYGLGILPRRLRSRILTQVMTGTIQHRHDAKEA